MWLDIRHHLFYCSEEDIIRQSEDRGRHHVDSYLTRYQQLKTMANEALNTAKCMFKINEVEDFI